MGSDRSYVNGTASGCQIFRETSGCYVVLHEHCPGRQLMTPTLAGAYAACRDWEMAGEKSEVPSAG
jgi:hypothetical protein